MIVEIPCSPEQEDVIADHLFYNRELGVLPDEKVWMLSQARKLIPNCKILGAELVIEKAVWRLSITV